MFVAFRPCVACGRQPSDPHYLQFAQRRVLGMKGSDKLTVPHCHGNHRQFHQAGNEVVWWQRLHINALEIAKGLWDKCRAMSARATDGDANVTYGVPPISGKPFGTLSVKA
jgi:hypothetical protein